jgi:hypothetical protein
MGKHFVASPAQHADHVNSVLQLCPKGLKVLSRRLWKWGNFRAEQFAGAIFGQNNLQGNVNF